MSFLKKIPGLVPIIRTYRSIMGITPSVLEHKYHTKRRNQVIDGYLANNSVKKLQIGCQSHPMSSWLNVDLEPKNDSIAIMDATKPFPLPDNTFDFVFTEHMFEHISFNQGEYMLKECYRVMKKGSKIRISTPNLKFLIELYGQNKNEVQKRYVEYSRKYFKHNEPLLDSVIINNYVRDWGHQFIHDEESLTYLLKKAGFTSIKFQSLQKSTIKEFQDLEKHGLEVTNEFNELESIIVEAEK
jgi:predicted SAM-dependent methyltransferase